MDVFDPDVPPVGHIDRVLRGSLRFLRHFPVSQNTTGNGQIFAFVEVETAVLFGIEQCRAGKIDGCIPKPLNPQEPPERESAAAESEHAAILAQLRKSVLNRGGIVGNAISFRAEVADIELRPACEESRGDHQKESQKRFHNAFVSRDLS